MKLANPFDLDWITIAWFFWLVQFAIYEYFGIKYGNETLSHHLWYIRNTGVSIVRFLFFALLLWINWHFIREGWNFFRH